jgi:hypothetical protein
VSAAFAPLCRRICKPPKPKRGARGRSDGVGDVKGFSLATGAFRSPSKLRRSAMRIGRDRALARLLQPGSTQQQAERLTRLGLVWLVDSRH